MWASFLELIFSLFLFLTNLCSLCRAKYGIDDMCRDQWNWASKNPYGFGESEE